MKDIEIRLMKADDWKSVSAIFQEWILQKNRTFLTKLPSWEQWDKSHIPGCRLVASVDNNIAGWAALSPAYTQEFFHGIAEVSIYLSEQYMGNGIGYKLLRELIKGSEENGFWSLQSRIFPDNLPSIRLHEKAGFEYIGTHRRLAKLNDCWRDVAVYERRSDVIN